MKYFKGTSKGYNYYSDIRTERPARRHLSQSPGRELLKYKYLPEVTNRNQMVLKEIFSTEQKHADNSQNKIQSYFNKTSYSGYALQQRNPDSQSMRSDSSRTGRGYEQEIKNNLQLIAKRSLSNAPHTIYEFESPVKTKTNIKNRSFDPIFGVDKVYNTPPVVFRSLGGNGPEAFYTSFTN